MIKILYKTGRKKDWQLTSDEATMELFRGGRGSCWGGVGGRWVLGMWSNIPTVEWFGVIPTQHYSLHDCK